MYYYVKRGVHNGCPRASHSSTSELPANVPALYSLFMVCSRKSYMFKWHNSLNHVDHPPFCICREIIQFSVDGQHCLTFASGVLTIAAYSCGVFFHSSGANIPLAQVVVVTSCNLRWWCFSIQPLAQIVHLHTWWYYPLQLALVVLFHATTGANTVHAPG